MTRTFVAGPNFSGRSDAVAARTRDGATPSFYIGPYAEAALSGLASHVADEVALYRMPHAPDRAFDFDAAAFAHRKPQSLSGGEQVRLALHCFAQSAFASIAIDTALEQLDRAHRAAALAFLGSAAFAAILADSRIDAAPEGWDELRLSTTADAPACDPATLAAMLPQVHAPAIGIDDLGFAYERSRPIFERANATLAPGAAYRLVGANGAGKTTLLRLLAGVLRPQRGALLCDGARYEPWRRGNALVALATQNPDHQWCGATLREDLRRRRRAPFDAAAFGTRAALLGAPSLDAHLYEMPLAMRKRLGWLWPLSGFMPWVVLDEPTIGQDRATRAALAQTIAVLCDKGYGVLVVTHDDDFASLFPHATLAIGGGGIDAN